MNKTCFCGISEHCGYQIETDMEQHDKVIYENGYNKALDDFAERLKKERKETITTSSAFVPRSFDEVVDEIAEQLKGEKQ